ncbi:MAG: hypothetical protein HZB51_15055 [Chloroflexi bacterium]|nr:hypothetical protein [Chloroflexota bacterium]
MRTNKTRFALVSTAFVVMLFGLLLLLVPVADAELALTNVVYSFDTASNNMGYQSAMVSIYADGAWQPFLHKFIGPTKSGNEFNDTVFISNVVASVNGVTQTYQLNTPYAGLLDYSVSMTATNGIGQGFRTTRRWSLVYCNRTKAQNNDPTPPWGDLNNADLALHPGNQYYTPTLLLKDLPTVFQNQVEPCGSGDGNCSYKLVTRLLVDISDPNNPNAINPAYLIPAGNTNAGSPAALCFYAEAKRPSIANWTGSNPQARISAGGGDKTVNFNFVAYSTAVALSSFSANSTTDLPILPTLFVVGLLSIVSFGVSRLILR